MSDVSQVVIVAGATACTVIITRAVVTLKLAAIRASISKTAQDFAMLERKPRKTKAFKTPTPPPYGL